MRRLNYLQYLLKCDENTMLNKFFKTQLSFPAKYDWMEQVQKDLIDFDWIKTTSVVKFRKLVKKRGCEYAQSEFNKQRESHSKLQCLEYDEFKLQGYLRNKNISVNQAQILLKFRTRMANYANNYWGTNPDMPCKLCSNH